MHLSHSGSLLVAFKGRKGREVLIIQEDKNNTKNNNTEMLAKLNIWAVIFTSLSYLKHLAKDFVVWNRIYIYSSECICVL